MLGGRVRGRASIGLVRVRKSGKNREENTHFKQKSRYQTKSRVSVAIRL